MANRYTATEKWDDPWFCGLSPAYKLFWIYICEKCNHAGIWNVNWPLVKFHCWENNFDVTQFGDRVVVISEDKWFIKKFVFFQQKINDLNDLNPLNNCHASIINILLKEGILSPLQAPSKPLLRGLGNSNGNSNSKGKSISVEKKDRKTNPDVNSCITHFFNKHQDIVGAKYHVDGGKDGTIIKNLLSTFTADELKSKIDTFFTSPSDFTKQAGFTIGVFKSQINKLDQNKQPKNEIVL